MFFVFKQTHSYICIIVSSILRCIKVINWCSRCTGVLKVLQELKVLKELKDLKVLKVLRVLRVFKMLAGGFDRVFIYSLHHYCSSIHTWCY